MYAAWLADFAARDVAAIGLGVVTLHRPTTDRDPFIVLQDVRGPIATPMGPSVDRGLTARVWLAEHDDADVLATAWTAAPDVTVEHHFIPGQADPRVIRVRQGGGLRHTEEIDTAAAALLSVADGELTAGAALTAIAALLEEDAVDLTARLLPVLRSWIAAGIVT